MYCDAAWTISESSKRNENAKCIIYSRIENTQQIFLDSDRRRRTCYDDAFFFFLILSGNTFTYMNVSAHRFPAANRIYSGWRFVRRVYRFSRRQNVSKELVKPSTRLFRTCTRRFLFDTFVKLSITLRRVINERYSNKRLKPVRHDCFFFLSSYFETLQSIITISDVSFGSVCNGQQSFVGQRFHFLRIFFLFFIIAFYRF